MTKFSHLVGVLAVGGLMVGACGASNDKTGTGGTGGSVTTGGKGGTGGAVASGGTGGTAGTGGAWVCSRATLAAATLALKQAITAGDATKLSLASGATYHENLQTPPFGQGMLWAGPLVVAQQRDFLDATLCQSFSEIVVTDAAHPYVLGIRLTQSAGKITDVTSLVADAGDFHFDATAFFTGTTTEDWSVVPEAQRPTRETAFAAGNAYFDYFNDRTIVVPVASTCTRLEGTNNDPCLEALPPVGRVQVTERTPLFDETLGTAVFMDKFRGLPDSHSFRVVGGVVTHMHAIIICDPTCAPPAPDGGVAGAGGGTAGAGGAAGVGGAGGAAGAAGTTGAAGGTSGASAGGAGGKAGAGGAAGGAGAAAGAGGKSGAGGA
jgi:hypothetical protein